MGFFNSFRSKKKASGANPEAAVYSYNLSPISPVAPWATARSASTRLPAAVLARIFIYLCPHTQDETFTTCDESLGEGCMLCQTCDLSCCAQVCRRWEKIANPLLYHSVRLDAVHFCGWENPPSPRAERKRKKSKADRQLHDVGTPERRLQLFARTVRDSHRLASRVNFLKVAYMTRESCKVDLARTVSVLSNLHYVDLPEGAFSNDASCAVLRQELESSCGQLRKMKYLKGSEQSLTSSLERQQWPQLEAVEIDGVEVEADALLFTLGSLQSLREVKLASMQGLTDDMFQPNPTYPPFPPVERLVLEKAPSVTAKGLCTLLSRPSTKMNLLSLTLKETGVLLHELHLVLGKASHLIELSVSDVVDRPFPPPPVPPLSSNTLETLFFGILPEHYNNHSPVSESYYAYLASSLLSNSLPALGAMFAYSDVLPTSLSNALLPPPDLPFAVHSRNTSVGSEHGQNSFLQLPGHSTFNKSASRLSTYSIASYYHDGSPNASRPSTSTGLPALNLDLYTKPPSQPELEWSLTQLRSETPASAHPIPSSVPAPAPAGAAAYTPNHFSTPNVRPPPQHNTIPRPVQQPHISRSGAASGSLGYTSDNPIPIQSPRGPDRALSSSSLARAGSSSNLHLPIQTISTTRPLSAVFAEQDHQQRHSASQSSLRNPVAPATLAQIQARPREALRPIDGLAVGRIGSGRVHSGRVASGVSHAGYGGLLAMPREWVDADDLSMSDVRRGSAWASERSASVASTTGRRKAGLVGDWMG